MCASMSTRRCGYLRDYSHIYMRWKEQCFLNAGEDCGLTIAGFYYVCMCRKTGEVQGTYIGSPSCNMVHPIFPRGLNHPCELLVFVETGYDPLLCNLQGYMWTHTRPPTTTCPCGPAPREELALRPSLLSNFDDKVALGHVSVVSWRSL